MKRPRGVTLLAGLALLAAVAQIVWAIGSGWFIHQATADEGAWTTTLGQLGRVLMGLIYGLIGFGLWNLRRWARRVAIGWSALAIVVITFEIFFGQQLTGFSVALWILLPVAGFYALCIAYMFNEKVKQAFAN
jgi:peptidoglycan/LPS O-acetylase OafA/YrhL